MKGCATFCEKGHFLVLTREEVFKVFGDVYAQMIEDCGIVEGLPKVPAESCTRCLNEASEAA